MSTVDHEHEPFPDKIQIFFASQTGQAESISEYIEENFSTGPLKVIGKHCTVERHCVTDFQKLLPTFLEPNPNLRKASHLLIVVASTTGQGDPPDKAIKFFRWIRRLKRTKGGGNHSNPLHHLSYALLGLGDTNYDQFANFAKQLDKTLLELGATPYILPAFADDAVGLEIVTEPFIELLITTIERHFARTIGGGGGGGSSVNESNNQISNTEARETEPCQNGTDHTDHTDHHHQAVKMNLDRPVVSSCEHLSSSDKRSLGDLCRQLLEPSASLTGKSIDQLTLPKLSTKLSQVTLHNRSIDSGAESDKASIYSLLKAKLNKETPLYEADITLESKLSTEPLKCCHTEKIVLECDVRYRMENDDEEYEFSHGDAFGIYSSNLLIDVCQVLLSVRFPLSDTSSDEEEDQWTLLWDYLKCNRKTIFLKLNDNSVVQLLPYLVFAVDLRTIPKKMALAQLAQHTTDLQQRRRLLELSSREGAEEYQKLILGHKVTICDILRLFDSCQPPLGLFLSHLISARPRYYSVASLPQTAPPPVGTTTNNKHCSFQILLSVSNQFSHTFMRSSENLLGTFSGKFFKHYSFASKSILPDLRCNTVWKVLESIQDSVVKGQILDNQDVSLYKSINFPVYIFPRANHSFQLSSDLSRSVVLIAAGTGIAPFLSYLQYRKQELPKLLASGVEIGKVYLFFGCRHPEQDFTYRDRLIAYCNKDPHPVIDHLCLCFSRCEKLQSALFEVDTSIKLCSTNGEQEWVKHVDQLLRLHGKELVELIDSPTTSVYVCGDWKKISASVNAALVDIFAQHRFTGNETKAGQFVKQLQTDRRYLQDVWT